MTYFRALLLACFLCLSSAHAQSLGFSFQNVQIIPSGPGYALQFEMHMNSTQAGTFHIGGNVYLKYNQAAFGDSAFAKGNVSYTRGPLLPAAQYVVDMRDFNLNDTTLSFSWFAMASLTNTPPSPAVYTAVPMTGSAMLAQVTMQIQNPAAPIFIEYDSARMNSLFTFMAPGPAPTSYVSPYSYQPPIILSVLPVSLSYLQGQREKTGDVQLKWQTTQEENSHYFEIEESLDGSNFSPKGRVTAAGYSYDEQHYQFVDQDAAPSRVYYRIRQVDLDGKYSFSDVVEVGPSELSGNDIWVKVYPVPASDRIYLESLLKEGALGQVEVYDVNGKTMWKENTSDKMLTLDLSTWPEGMYLFRAESPEGKQYIGRFTKR